MEKPQPTCCIKIKSVVYNLTNKQLDITLYNNVVRHINLTQLCESGHGELMLINNESHETFNILSYDDGYSATYPYSELLNFIE